MMLNIGVLYITYSTVTSFTDNLLPIYLALHVRMEGLVDQANIYDVNHHTMHSVRFNSKRKVVLIAMSCHYFIARRKALDERRSCHDDDADGAADIARLKDSISIQRSKLQAEYDVKIKHIAKENTARN